MSLKNDRNQFPQKLLLVRLDRIGDLVLSLPVDEAFIDCEVHWWIPKGLSFITENAEPRRSSSEIDRQITLKKFFALWRTLRRERFDAGIVFHAPWWVSLLLFLSGVRIRAGVKSQWHSFLFLNRTVRQKRSRAEYSELEYNYRLVESAFRFAPGSLSRKQLKLKSRLSEESSLLNRFGLQAQSYSVVHPGMGGSALNWPTESYCNLILSLAQKEKVAITGTATDEAYLAPLKAKLKSNPQIIWLDGKLSGEELIAVLQNARTIIAPSTGVLHLAASTGQPTLGIFSPVRVQQPRRWGPQGLKVATLMPTVECPGQMSCLGSQCQLFDCMERITSDDALRTLEVL